MTSPDRVKPAINPRKLLEQAMRRAAASNPERPLAEFFDPITAQQDAVNKALENFQLGKEGKGNNE